MRSQPNYLALVLVVVVNFAVAVLIFRQHAASIFGFVRQSVS